MARKINSNQVLVGFMLYEFANEDEADRFMTSLKSTDLAVCETEIPPMSKTKYHPDSSDMV